jgi:hypothetical protein
VRAQLRQHGVAKVGKDTPIPVESGNGDSAQEVGHRHLVRVLSEIITIRIRAGETEFRKSAAKSLADLTADAAKSRPPEMQTG